MNSARSSTAMDFFEAQDLARRRSGRLVWLFVAAVLGTVVALYAAAWGVARLAGQVGEGWWQPGLAAGVGAGACLVIGGSAAWRGWQLRAGGPAVAELLGGRALKPGSVDPKERTLLNVVEEMALAAGLPVPVVFVLPEEPGINAFAAGMSPADAAVAVSAGALERLDRSELQGVVAHEFSHILNGDMRLNTRLAAWVHGLHAVSALGGGLLRAMARGGVRHARSRSGKGDGGHFVLAAAGVALLIIGWAGKIGARLIQAAVSRQREYLADAAAVQFTRLPEGLAGALKKVGGAAVGGGINAAGVEGFSHHCFVQCFASSLSGFDTHPPLASRIRAIEPGWDGRYVATRARGPAGEMQSTGGSPGASPLMPPLVRASRVDPAALVADAGQLGPRAVAAGAALLASLPDELREAAHSATQAGPLCYALCVPASVDVEGQTWAWAMVKERDGREAAREAERLHVKLAGLAAETKLSLAQIALPALRGLSPEACATVMDTLHALSHADGRVSPYEYALQKILSRALGLVLKPRSVLRELAPKDVASELSLLLSTAARLEAGEGEGARSAYARAAASFNGLHPPLAYVPVSAGGLVALDAALDRLALTPALFRRRVLTAVAVVFAADGTVSEAEADLLRAVGAALDCPLPPVSVGRRPADTR